MSNTTTPYPPTPAAWPPHMRKALDEHYKAHGVGETAAQKHAFWRSENPDTCIFWSGTDQGYVDVFEMEWLGFKFPEEMELL